MIRKSERITNGGTNRRHASGAEVRSDRLQAVAWDCGEAHQGCPHSWGAFGPSNLRTIRLILRETGTAELGHTHIRHSPVCRQQRFRASIRAALKLGRGEPRTVEFLTSHQVTSARPQYVLTDPGWRSSPDRLWAAYADAWRPDSILLRLPDAFLHHVFSPE